MSTLADYIANHDITLDILRGPDPAIAEDGWEYYAYQLRLDHGLLGNSMNIPWLQGLLVTDDPEVGNVMDVLIGESWSYYQADDFEDWAGEYGYDSDSRKAYALWLTIEKQSKLFLAFLGDTFDALEELALRTERPM